MKAVTVLAQCRHKKCGYGCEYECGRECSLKNFFETRKVGEDRTERRGKGKATGRTKGEGEEGREKCGDRGPFVFIRSEEGLNW